MEKTYIYTKLKPVSKVLFHMIEGIGKAAQVQQLMVELRHPPVSHYGTNLRPLLVRTFEHDVLERFRKVVSNKP